MSTHNTQIFIVIEEDINLDEYTIETYTDAFTSESEAQAFLEQGFTDIKKGLIQDNVSINLENREGKFQADLETDQMHYHFELQTVTMH